MGSKPKAGNNKTLYVLFIGQLISEANCQAKNSSKKWTNEFIYDSMRLVFVRFLEEIEGTKRHFEIIWP